MTSTIRMRRHADNPNRLTLTIDEGDGERDLPGTFTYWNHDRWMQATAPYHGRFERIGGELNGRRLYDVRIYFEDIQVLYIPPKEEP